MFLPFSSKYMQSSAKYFFQGVWSPAARFLNSSCVRRTSSSCVMPFFALQAVNVSNVGAIARSPPTKKDQPLIHFCISFSDLPTKAPEKYTLTSKFLTFAFCHYNHPQCFAPSCTQIPPAVSSTLSSSRPAARTAPNPTSFPLPALPLSPSPTP